MNNISRIKKFSKNFHLLLTFFLAAIPIYYIVYWIFINDFPETLVAVNVDNNPLIATPLSVKLRLIGFFACLLPLSALVYGLLNIRKLFSFYKDGVIFSFEHVRIFRKISKALVFWVFTSVLYASAKSILFTIGNPPGQRTVSVGFGSPEITTLVVAGIVFVIAWVMDEGRILTEEQNLTV